ncbi:hypothetical protein CKALI_00050 [Corynebacterium kalinowskii]|uniref:Uncharacterized protein n=1 Tax=Corynebacterium kalinowskii TaxID=2675216 RepID=A0A6B8VH41_9CORY|nr:hypothetical protein [Corynebacterium kalinowskii]QGU00914.1 hypothetical protein CKALI_00050 [Corynebacterium kalinowskii]
MITISDRAALVSDLADFARTTVNNQSGITGMALKGGLAAATKAKPNIVEAGLGHVLNDVIGVLNPYWDSKPEGTSFGEQLDANKDRVAEELLQVADGQSKNVTNQTLVKVYNSLRGKVAKVLAENVRGLGDIVEKHAA